MHTSASFQGLASCASHLLTAGDLLEAGMMKLHRSFRKGGQEHHQAAPDAQQLGCQMEQVFQRLCQGVGVCGRHISWTQPACMVLTSTRQRPAST